MCRTSIFRQIERGREKTKTERVEGTMICPLQALSPAISTTSSARKSILPTELGDPAADVPRNPRWTFSMSPHLLKRHLKDGPCFRLATGAHAGGHHQICFGDLMQPWLVRLLDVLQHPALPEGGLLVWTTTHLGLSGYCCSFFGAG